MFWSDIMAACCDKAMAEYGDGDMKGLEAIWRVTIVNKVRELLAYILCQ